MSALVSLLFRSVFRLTPLPCSGIAFVIASSARGGHNIFSLIVVSIISSLDLFLGLYDILSSIKECVFRACRIQHDALALHCVLH